MAHIRIPRLRSPRPGGSTGVGRLRNALGRRRRPTGDELAQMTDADFAAFVESSGIKTVTTTRVAESQGPSD